MKQHFLSLVTITGIAALIALSGGGCKSSKKAPAAVTPMPVPANSFVRQWANDLKLAKDSVDKIYLTPDTVFVYTVNHLVYAINRSGGNLNYLAQPAVSGGVVRQPLVLGERVVFPSGSTIDVFNNRGRRARTIELNKSTRSGATGLGNTMYIGLDHTGGTGVMASIDITKPYHVENWELMTYGAIDGTPAMFEKDIFVASEDGRLYAVTEERGQVWVLENGAGYFETQGKFVSDITVDDFGVFASNTDSKLYCLDRANGKIKWIYYSGVPLKTAPVVTATMVYQYAEGSGIVAIEKTTGTFDRAPKWAAKNAVQFLSEDQQFAYLRRRDGRLIAVDRATGQLAFISNKHPFEVFATNTKDGMIYGSTKDGNVWAVRPVVKEGEVGHIVMDFRAERLDTVASAR